MRVFLVFLLMAAAMAGGVVSAADSIDSEESLHIGGEEPQAADYEECPRQWKIVHAWREFSYPCFHDGDGHAQGSWGTADRHGNGYAFEMDLLRREQLKLSAEATGLFFSPDSGRGNCSLDVNELFELDAALLAGVDFDCGISLATGFGVAGFLADMDGKDSRGHWSSRQGRCNIFWNARLF